MSRDEVRPAQARLTNEILVAFLAAVLLMGTIWLITAHAGAVGIPRSDDWSYLLTQFEFDQTGRFTLRNWAVMMLIGQTLAAWPLGQLFGVQNILVLQAAVAVIGAVSIVVTYWLCRQAVNRPYASISTAALALSPVFGPSTVSFMTDVPSLALQTLALAAAVIALRNPRRLLPWFIASQAIGLIAFTFRDYSLVVNLVTGALFAVHLRRKPSQAAIVGAITLTVLGLAGGLYFWRHSLPMDNGVHNWEPFWALTLVARGLITVSLLILPALALVSPRRVIQSLRELPWSWWSVWLVPALLVLLLSRGELLGNIIHPFGDSWLTVGPGFRFWPLWVNRLIIVTASLAFLLTSLIGLLGLRTAVTRVKTVGLTPVIDELTGRSPVATLLVGYGLAVLTAHSLATLAVGAWYLDRYFISVVPFGCLGIILVSRHLGLVRARLQLVVPGVVLALFALFSLHVTDLTALSESARWQAGLAAEKAGIPAANIDAGQQWVGFYEPHPGVGPNDVLQRPERPWWQNRYPGRAFCATVVTSQSPEDLQYVIEELRHRSLLGVEFTSTLVEGPDRCSH